MTTPAFLRLHDSDLHLTDSDRRVVVRESVLFAVVCAVAVIGVGMPAGLALTGSLGLAVVAAAGGGIVPLQRVRKRAETMRGEFDLAVSVLLDLMNIQTAGGAGVETALLSSAALGDGWSFALIRDCLAGAQASRTSYWDALAGLGESTGCRSLVEVAHSARLAGEHGSRIRQTLASKSASLRARNLARIEYRAQQRTEQMGLPMVVLFVSFLVFVGYPALAQTMTAV